MCSNVQNDAGRSNLECYPLLPYFGNDKGESMQLADEEKRELLRIARASIEEALKGHPPVECSPEQESLRQPCGVFVTLRQQGELRGCIGYVEPRFPLSQAVAEVAMKSAFDDPRFAPLTPRELPSTEIEISVLSPLSKVANIDSIEIGLHGLVIDAGYTRGLLLPHVATEYLWDRRQFLDHTAIKAGLPPEIWRTDKVQIYSFTTTTFSESELLQPHG